MPVIKSIDVWDDGKYRKFCRAELPMKTGECGIDPEKGVWEEWLIGMVRNARPENRKPMRVYLKPTPHVIRDQNVPLRGWYKSKVEPKGVRPRPCYTEALLTQPYGGRCPLNCVMCYINNGVRGYRGQGISVVDPEYPVKIEKQLSEMNFGWAAYISGYTEPFQPLEEVYHNVEQLSEVLTSYGLPIFYLTRRIPPDWAVKYLKRSRFSYMQYSIITCDQEDHRKICPRAALLDDTYRSIRELRDQGIYISIQVDPIIPGITSQEQVVELIGQLARAGAHHLIFKFVEMVESAAPVMMYRMKRLFPDRWERFAELWCENIGNVRNIRESYRVESLNLYKHACEMNGVTMSLCFEFCYERDAAGNIMDKTGVNMGPRFLTADQCHGQRVPIHIKHEGRFVPWDVCPPSGCLYCREACGSDIPCGVPYLAEAHALKPEDYRREYWRTR